MTASLPSSHNLLMEAFFALGLVAKLPPTLRQRAGGARSFPTEATADKRAVPPHRRREQLLGSLCYALVPPPALQGLMALPSEEVAWIRWTGMVDMAACRCREWDALTDALQHPDFEHPRLVELRRFNEQVHEPVPEGLQWVERAFERKSGVVITPEMKTASHEFMVTRERILRERMGSVASTALDAAGMERLKALLVRLIIREIALREAAGTLAWGFQNQDVGTTWHLLKPVEWLEHVLQIKASGLPRTTLARWTSVISGEQQRIQWKSVERLVAAVAEHLHADAAATAKLRLRIAGHVVFRRLGIALQQVYPDARQQLAEAYTRQVRHFRSLLAARPGGVSLEGGQHDLRELALYGPAPASIGGYFVEHVLRDEPIDRLEAHTILHPLDGVLMAHACVPAQLPIRDVLATSAVRNPTTTHPLGVTALLPDDILKLISLHV